VRRPRLSSTGVETLRTPGGLRRLAGLSPTACRVGCLVLALAAFATAAFERRIVFDLRPDDYVTSFGRFTWRAPDADVDPAAVGATIPYVLPGPSDRWAGSRAHALRFTLAEPAASRLRLELHTLETHEGLPPRLAILTDGVTRRIQTRPGTGLPPPHKERGTRHRYRVGIPAAPRSGPWSLTLTNEAGSWVMWKRIRLLNEARTLEAAHLSLPGPPPTSLALLAGSFVVLLPGTLGRRRPRNGTAALRHASGPVAALLVTWLAWELARQGAVPLQPRWLSLALPWLFLAVFAGLSRLGPPPSRWPRAVALAALDLVIALLTIHLALFLAGGNRVTVLGMTWEASSPGAATLALAALVLLLSLILAFSVARDIREGALNGTLVVLGCLMAAILGEVIARVALEPPPKVYFEEGRISLPDGEKTLLVDTPRGRRHRPNIEVVIEDPPSSPNTKVVYKTNSLGYRDREIGPKRGPRILFLGDSITFGLWLNDELTFVRLVEKLARENGKVWETVNAAVQGLGMDAELAVLNETGLSIEPDVVVLGYYLNDFQESPGIYAIRLPGPLKRSWLAYRVVNLVAALPLVSQAEASGAMLKSPELQAWRKEFEANSPFIPRDREPDPIAARFNQAVLKSFDDWGGAFSPRVWEKQKLLVEEFARLARAHRFQPVIVAFPVRHQVEAGPLFDEPQRRLGGIAADLRIPYLDLLPLLRAEYQKNNKDAGKLFFDQCHLTPYGSQITARAIYQVLEGWIGRREKAG